MAGVRVLLISTYDLGRQPLGLASPAASLRREGVEVECLDASRETVEDGQIRAADLVAFFLPMHTATRLAAPLIDRVRHDNPRAQLAAYGLYAPLNAAWLHDRGVQHVLGPEAEAELIALSTADRGGRAVTEPDARIHASAPASAPAVRPDRSTLPPLSRYAALQMPDGSRKVVGSTDATRGCKHLCRHCPIVPVYEGRFRAVALDVVMADVRALVDAGAQHISFGDPDFLNGPTHARRLVERLARECSGITYDVTIKIEHLLNHADLLPLLRNTGCLVITSAVESIDDEVLRQLRKGHTRSDFVKAVELCRQAGLTLSPTFVPFTPWTTVAGYVDLLRQISALELVNAVAPIQLAIRLLVTAHSKLLELADIQAVLEPFDGQSLTFPWRHPDPRVDALQGAVMQIVSDGAGAPRAAVFDRLAEVAGAVGGNRSVPLAVSGHDTSLMPPYMTEAWYCCAEPGPELRELV